MLFRQAGPLLTHRHRYFGVLAPNSLLRSAVTALVQQVKQVIVQADPAATGEGAPGVVPLGHASPPTPEPAPPKRSPAHYLWAVLIARIYEVFPLLYPMCGGQMPDVPTLAESGIAGYEAINWYGVMAPGATPREVIAKLHADTLRALKSPEVIKRLTGEGGEIVANTPEEFAAMLRRETDKWAKVVKDASVKVD